MSLSAHWAAPHRRATQLIPRLPRACATRLSPPASVVPPSRSAQPPSHSGASARLAAFASVLPSAPRFRPSLCSPSVPIFGAGRLATPSFTTTTSARPPPSRVATAAAAGGEGMASAPSAPAPSAPAAAPAVPADAPRPFVGDLGVRSGFTDAIGNTPLIRLTRASEETGCEIYGKAEFLNPGGSVKDRAALYIIKAAEASGALRPGGIIVEGTAGNTGIGLALVANARGYKTVIVIPNTQSQEKKDMLRIAGATLVEVPACPYRNPNNYVRYSGRLAEKMAKSHPGGAIWGNQFDNLANRQAHYETTGPEIWCQLAGRVDGFICAIGTGGTLAGTGKYLKDQRPGVRVGAVDPMGAGMFSYYQTGEMKAQGNSISEGIGQSRVTGNLEGWGQRVEQGGSVDYWCQASDEEALPVMYDLLRYEGLCLGLSSGINVVGAMKLAKEMGPGHTIVTVLCDYGTRYQGKLFNTEFLKSKGLPLPAWMDADAAGDVEVPEVYEEVESA